MAQRTEQRQEKEREAKGDSQLSDEARNYLRFGLMILTAMVVMYVVTYLNTYQWSHVRWSETRFFMTLLMGATMAVVMLLFMLGMYRNKTANTAVVGLAIAVLLLGVWLVRSQETVGDTSYMNAMIPHHSIAILTSERACIEDIRVRELADSIITAQQKEIAEMEWLIQDINENGVVTSEEGMQDRPAPTFEGGPQEAHPCAPAR